MKCVHLEWYMTEVIKQYREYSWVRQICNLWLPCIKEISILIGFFITLFLNYHVTFSLLATRVGIRDFSNLLNGEIAKSLEISIFSYMNCFLCMWIAWNVLEFQLFRLSAFFITWYDLRILFILEETKHGVCKAWHI